MYVLRFKPDTKNLVFFQEEKEWRNIDISGRYLAAIPNDGLRSDTGELSKAWVFTSEEAAKRCFYFANTEIVEVEIRLK